MRLGFIGNSVVVVVMSGLMMPADFVLSYLTIVGVLRNSDDSGIRDLGAGVRGV